MDSIFIEKEKPFKDEYIQNNPIGNRIDIENVDLKTERIMNIRPMLSSSEPTSGFIPENRKVKIKPILSKKVPSNTFSLIANQKKIHQIVLMRSLSLVMMIQGFPTKVEVRLSTQTVMMKRAQSSRINLLPCIIRKQ
jgi:hypothetical protein